MTSSNAVPMARSLFFFQAEDGIRDGRVTGVQTCALPISDARFGDLLEMRGRGKEDSRGGAQDLMVLGTHILDLMRFIAGECRWCYARVGMMGKEGVTPVTKAEDRKSVV